MALFEDIFGTSRDQVYKTLQRYIQHGKEPKEEAERGLHRSHALEVMSEELADMQRADGGSEKGS